MNKVALFSIIIPIYNAEDYLTRCINSVINQNFTDYELILVNDGSTDSSKQICERYQKQFPQVILISQENKGHTMARNVGLKCARGKYVLFIDSDDWIESGMLSELFTVITQNDALDMILFGYQRVINGHVYSKPLPFKEGFYDRTCIVKELHPTLLTSGHFSLSERVMTRELALRYQQIVDPRIRIGEDMLCCVCALANAKSIYVSKKVYYNYFQNDTSIIQSYENYNFEDWRLIRQLLIGQLSSLLVNLDAQLGYCSIRFLDRAVIGEIERKGLSFKTIFKLRITLNDFLADLKKAKSIPKKRNINIKYFCLCHKLILLYYVIFKIYQIKNKIKRYLYKI